MTTLTTIEVVEFKFHKGGAFYTYESKARLEGLWDETDFLNLFPESFIRIGYGTEEVPKEANTYALGDDSSAVVFINSNDRKVFGELVARLMT